MATLPSSISNTPHKAAVGITGRPASQELFTYNLELALLSVLQKEDEYGRDSIFKWRSEKELYQNAWSTPTFWDWSSSGSASSYVSEASTPGISTPVETGGVEEDASFEPPRAWSMIRDQIQTKVVAPIKTCTQLNDPLPRKRKLDHDGGEDECLHPRKKVRTGLIQPPFAIDELTPPSSPPLYKHDLIKVAVQPDGYRSSPRGISYGEITPPDHDEKDIVTTSSFHMRSTRSHLLPP